MNESLVIGSVVVPGVVATVIGAIWSLLSARAQKELEARLERRGEAFRLAQSPRVESALALWTAVCEYERAVADLVSPYDPVFLPEEASREERRLEVQQHQQAAVVALGTAHRGLVEARARAECLVPQPAFEAVLSVLSAVGEADDAWARSRAEEPNSDERGELVQAARAALEKAPTLRPAAVAALRGVIDGEAAGG